MFALFDGGPSAIIEGEVEDERGAYGEVERAGSAKRQVEVVGV
jgi:hypothetical protein